MEGDEGTVYQNQTILKCHNLKDMRIDLIASENQEATRIDLMTSED